MMHGHAGARVLSAESGARQSLVRASAAARRGKRLVMPLAKLGISACAIAIVLHAVDVPSIVAGLTQQNAAGLAAAAAVMLVQLALGALRWHLVRLNTGIRSGFIDTFRIYYVGSFFGSTVWSGMSGDVVRI
jgi:glycosyltransferase 2 family protein